MDHTTENRKRKYAGEAAAAYQCSVSPKFGSCEMTAASVVPRCVTACAMPAEASYASLPRELFCNIVGYIGPTSSTLCALSQVNRNHQGMLRSIGNVMLQRARLRFRLPLPPRSARESSISLFVRHARSSKAVHDRLEVLKRVLWKDFPVVSTLPLPETTHFAPESCEYKRTSSHYSCVEPFEVEHALNIALCLLGCWKRHYFEDPDEARDIARSAASTALEWRVSRLCSELGARAYKYAKSRMCRRYVQEDLILSAYVATDELRRGEGGDVDEDSDEDMSVDSSEYDDDEDVNILDKASLVMQHVLVREQRRARLNGHAAAMVVNQVHNMLN